MEKENVFLPEKIEYIKEEVNRGRFIIEPCWPGYGITWGNALRRVLMSSLKGGAVDRVVIKGVRHEFSTIDGIKEDVLQIILNLKQLRFKVFSDEEVELSLEAKGVGAVQGKDIEKSAQAVVVNPEQKIATLTSKKASLEMKLWVKSGYGWVSSEEKSREGLEIGTIVLDSQFSPIVEAATRIENMRVGKRTDFERLILTLQTDGSISPQEAFREASRLLEEHFSFLKSSIVLEEKAKPEKEVKESKKKKKIEKKDKEKAAKKTKKKETKKTKKKTEKTKKK